MLCDDAAGRRRLQHITAVCQSVRIPPGVDNAASDWQTLLNGDYFTLRERLIIMQKQLKEPRSILMSSADRVAHIDGQFAAIIGSNTQRFQRSINAQSNKTEQSIYECLLGFCLTFSALPNFVSIDSFLLPNSRNEEMMG